MAEANAETAEPKKSKNGVRKIFGFGKKKKKPTDDHPGYCPYCAEKNIGPNPSPAAIQAYEEKLREEISRKQQNFPEASRPDYKPNYQDETETVCKCTRCQRQRGEDPLTVELLPMDTQVTLQNSLLQDAGFMCCIL